MAQKDYTAERSDYMTPASIYNTLLQIAGVEFFNTDVCCSRKNIPALHHCIEGERDGLQFVWHGPCFLNPPFKTAEKWVRRAVELVKDNDKLAVYAVLPADRFETKYYQECILKNPHCVFCFLPYKTNLSRCHTSSTYSWIVLSDENLPQQAVFISDIFAQRFLSA